MNKVKDVKIDEGVNSFQRAEEVSKTDHKSTDELKTDDMNLESKVQTTGEELNYITISTDGEEASYHKGGLILAVLIIFLLGVLAGALIF